MQNRLRSSGITSTSALVVLILAACGGDGATILTDATPTDLDADRIEIVFAYSPGELSVPTTMDLFQATRDGRLAAPVIATSDMEFDPEWSRDGSKLAFTRTTSGQTNVASIWIADADGSGLRQLIIDPT